MRSVGLSYYRLNERFPLRKVSNDEDLALADAIADELWSRDDLDQGENDYLDALNILIRAYEKTAHQFPAKKVSPREMLLFLLEENGMKQVDLCKLLVIPSGRASEIVSGVRELSKQQIATIADHFCVDAAFFLPRPVRPAASAGKTRGSSFEVPGLYVSADDTRIVSDKYRITMGSKGTKPSTAPAKKKKKLKVKGA